LKIGLTQRILNFRGRAYDSIEHGWYSYLKEHTLVFVPNRLDQDFESVAQEVDCLIITGGDDRLIRRTTELQLATAVIKQQKPILGVCHGAFLLTDVFGGIVGRKDGHRDGIEHVVRYCEQDYVVNSFHGLAIESAPPTAQVLARDPDGTCESWIDGLVAAVVWHPERMANPWLPTEIQNLIFKDNK